jgi:hypothetical protein
LANAFWKRQSWQYGGISYKVVDLRDMSTFSRPFTHTEYSPIEKSLACSVAKCSTITSKPIVKRGFDANKYLENITRDIEVNYKFASLLKRTGLNNGRVLILDHPFTRKTTNCLISENAAKEIWVPNNTITEHQAAKNSSKTENDISVHWLPISLHDALNGFAKNMKWNGMLLDFTQTFGTCKLDIQQAFQIVSSFPGQRCLIGITLCLRGERSPYQSVISQVIRISVKHGNKTILIGNPWKRGHMITFFLQLN